jgi:hypothetical protein
LAKKEQNEFEIARKKRRRKFAAQRSRKFIGAVLLFAILCGGIYFFIEEDVAGIIGDRIASSASAGEGFPVDISGTNVIKTFTVGEHFGVLTDAVYYLYAENGKQLLSAQHDFANPKVEAAGRRFLVYDQGGNRLFVRMRDKILFEKEFEYKGIYKMMKIGNGVVAVNSSMKVNAVVFYLSVIEKVVVYVLQQHRMLIRKCKQSVDISKIKGVIDMRKRLMNSQEKIRNERIRREKMNEYAMIKFNKVLFLQNNRKSITIRTDRDNTNTNSNSNSDKLCQMLYKAAYKKWKENDDSVDDITIIAMCYD